MKANKKQKIGELWIKIRDLITLITKNSDDYGKNIWKSNLIQMASYL